MHKIVATFCAMSSACPLWGAPYCTPHPGHPETYIVRGILPPQNMNFVQFCPHPVYVRGAPHGRTFSERCGTAVLGVLPPPGGLPPPSADGGDIECLRGKIAPHPPRLAPSPPLMPGGGVPSVSGSGGSPLKRSPGFIRPRRGLGFPARSVFHLLPPVRGSGCAPPLIPSGLHPVPGSLHPVRRRNPAPGVSVPGAGSHAPPGHGSPTALRDISRGAHSPGFASPGCHSCRRKPPAGGVPPPPPSGERGSKIRSFCRPPYPGKPGA